MRPAAVWPLAIVAVLGVTVIANVWMWRAANEPGASALEPDYYARAVAWDSTQAERSRSAALGWRAEAAFIRGAEGAAAVRVRLLDRGGAPVEGARVEVQGIHNLESEHPAHWSLAERSPGVYVAEDAGRRRAGRWELRVSATTLAGRFESVEHAESPGAMSR